MADFGFNDLEGSLENWDSDINGYEYNNDDEEEKERNYSITYEIAFNTEEEKEEWYGFIRKLKAKFPDVDTISERILIAVREWLKDE